MHKLVLSGIAALAVLAIATGGHGAPAQADSVQAQRHSIPAPLPRVSYPG